MQVDSRPLQITIRVESLGSEICRLTLVDSKFGERAEFALPEGTNFAGLADGMGQEAAKPTTG